ncbi:MAG: helix-hairpin-helix domain-containing protein [Leifsonia sp.]
MRHRSESGPKPGDYTDDDAVTGENGAGSARIRIGVGAGVVILIVTLVGAVLLNAFAQAGSDAEITHSALPVTHGASPSPNAPAAGANAPVLVHVLGAVNRPGLVSLSGGARVVDAVAAAGGLTDEADVSGVNLARVVSDGEQLIVPRVGEVVAPSASAGSAAEGAAGGAAGALVNLNSASQQELETLPRIGPALAGRILDWRTANGRFAAITDLMKVTGVGQKLFDGLKDRVTV